jgi:hypothetical protein
MGKRAEKGDKTGFAHLQQAPKKGGQIAQRGSDIKSFRIQRICTAFIQTIKKAASGFPGAASRSS